MQVAVFPAECSEGLTSALALAGADLASIEDLVTAELGDAALLVLELGDEPMRRLRHLERVVEEVGLPVLVVADPSSLPLIERAKGVTDFVLEPLDPVELGVRVRRQAQTATTDEILRFKDLELNPLTYQATLDGRALDLTYMEYELLRFLVENQRRVWSRQQLLSKVWGYDYYGGARTVDVHVRRVRAKLGEERASWITTVRSVGYRFG
ncbi:MAG TPA: response regulator transcription factor [Acidimicrobiia bacterium]|nr:response regulator transcription factor [Acidimicrobiia bacterium]